MHAPGTSHHPSSAPGARGTTVVAVTALALLLTACGGDTKTTTSTVTVTSASTPTTTAPSTVPTTAATPTATSATVTAPTTPTTTATTATTPSARPMTAARRREKRLEQSAERTVRSFYAAVRNRNTSAVCSLLSTANVQRYGGRQACHSGRYVTQSAVSQVPPNNDRMRLTTILTAGATRATVLVSRPGRRYAVRLARQGHQWRVAGTRKFG